MIDIPFLFHLTHFILDSAWRLDIWCPGVSHISPYSPIYLYLLVEFGLFCCFLGGDVLKVLI